MGISKNATMVNKVSSDQTEKREKADQSGVYKITCGQCDSIYIGETGRKFSTRMKEHANSKAKRDDKSLFGKHCNDEGHSSEEAEQKFETLHIETSTRRRKLKEQLEIVKAKKEGKQVLINNVTQFESEKLFGLVIGKNKTNTLGQ